MFLEFIRERNPYISAMDEKFAAFQVDAYHLIIIGMLVVVIVILWRHEYFSPTSILGPRCGIGYPECPVGYSNQCYVDPETNIGRCLLSSECGYQKIPCPGSQECHITHTVLADGYREGVGFCA
jgi:hypothetical protein